MNDELQDAIDADAITRSPLRGAYPHLIRKGVFKGVDLKLLVERFWRMDAMRVDDACHAPEVRFRSSERGDYVTGRAYTAMRDIVMTIHVGASIERVVEVLLHEIVHCSCPLKESHGELFCRRLIACAREAFGLDLDTSALLAISPEAKHRGRRAYAIDEVITDAMVAAKIGDRLRLDPSVRFDPPPPESPADVAAHKDAARASRVAERERHARAMLATWEKRLAAAKTRAAKWRSRVKGYERRELQAAKRRGGAS